MRRYFWLLPIFLTVLAGCRVDIHSDLYSQDLFATENVTFPAQIKFEIPSCSSTKRAEYESRVLAVFSESSKAKLAGCKQEGMDSMVTVNFLGEVAAKESSHDLVIFRDGGSDRVDLSMTLNSNFVSRVQSLMRENMQRLRADQLRVTVDVNNDASQNVTVDSMLVWVNGKATQVAVLTLKRREKVNIGASNVFSELLVDDQQPFLLTIRR